MADIDVFHCEPREKTGSGGARATRREGWIPGVLYGGGDNPVPIQLKHNEVLKAYLAGRMRSHLAKIDVPGEEGQQSVIARDVQLDPVKDLPVHVDLMRVDEKTRIDVQIPVRFLNEDDSPGLKKGGVLNVVRHMVEVYAPATAIPEVFEIDVTGLEVGDTIHASAISMPEGVKLVTTDRDFTIATIAAPSALRSADEDEGASEEAAEEGEAAAEEEEAKEE
ncbi:MAG: 50S ribosomal protein L25/general stress protein Ctc [Hyphococcus sp.]